MGKKSVRLSRLESGRRNAVALGFIFVDFTAFRWGEKGVLGAISFLGLSPHGVAVVLRRTPSGV